MAALTGFRVVELAGSVAGEYCGKLLADFGAEVIKVETPGWGSPTRAMAPVFGDGAGREGSALFAYLNTNKHSVEVDVTSAAGALRLHELVGTADAVIDDSAVSWADRHPSVVFCSITPFGQGPPRSSKMPRASTCSTPAAGGITLPAMLIPPGATAGTGPIPRRLRSRAGGGVVRRVIAVRPYAYWFRRVHRHFGAGRASFPRRLHPGQIHHRRGPGRCPPRRFRSTGAGIVFRLCRRLCLPLHDQRRALAGCEDAVG